MKNVILSADGDRMVWSVPDVVAANLEEYCMEFCCRWLHNIRSEERRVGILCWLRESPDAAQYRTPMESGEVLCCYNESDFIKYLDQFLFPGQPCVFVENIGDMSLELPVPERYRDCPEFNF